MSKITRESFLPRNGGMNMKRALVPVTIIAGILFLLLTPSVSFARDWHALKARHGHAVIVERHYVPQPYFDRYRCVTPSYGWHYDRWPGYAPRPYDPRYDSRDAYGPRNLIHQPAWAFGFSAERW
jgi:hypothetical protein